MKRDAKTPVAGAEGPRPVGKLVIDRDAQHRARQSERVARGQLVVEIGRRRSGRRHRFPAEAGALPQHSEILHVDVDHRAATSRLPPRFSSSRTSATTISCDNALHMS